jgi:hypothetical protein
MGRVMRALMFRCHLQIIAKTFAEHRRRSDRFQDVLEMIGNVSPFIFLRE